MGKKNSKKRGLGRQRREELRGQQELEERRDPNRRMRRALIGAGLGLAGLGGFLGWDYFFGEDGWEFLDVDTTMQAEPAEYVVTNYVPISPLMEAPDGILERSIRKDAEPAIIREIQERGFDPAGNYVLTLRKQHFGIPEREGIAESMRD